MSNIAEGFKRGGTKELLHVLCIAQGSTAEVRSLVCVAADPLYIDKETCAALHTKTVAIAQQIAGLIRYLQADPYQGPRHKTER